MNNIKTWVEGEVKAAEYLKKIGYKIIDKNCKICGSEIDIVAILSKKEQKILLINEFKSRKFEDKKQELFHKNSLKREIKSLKDKLVFVEVKFRSSKKFGAPYESVGKQKQHNLVRGVLAYNAKFNIKNLPIRIDVISIVDDQIEHITNAFDV